MTEPLPKLVTDGLSPKVLISTVLATLLGIAVAVLNHVQANPALIGSLPPWAQWVLLVSIPPLLVGLAGYQAPAIGVVVATGRHAERDAGA